MCLNASLFAEHEDIGKEGRCQHLSTHQKTWSEVVRFLCRFGCQEGARFPHFRCEGIVPHLSIEVGKDVDEEYCNRPK